MNIKNIDKMTTESPSSSSQPLPAVPSLPNLPSRTDPRIINLLSDLRISQTKLIRQQRLARASSAATHQTLLRDLQTAIDNNFADQLELHNLATDEALRGVDREDPRRVRVNLCWRLWEGVWKDADVQWPLTEPEGVVEWRDVDWEGNRASREGGREDVGPRDETLDDWGRAVETGRVHGSMMRDLPPDENNATHRRVVHGTGSFKKGLRWLCHQAKKFLREQFTSQGKHPSREHDLDSAL
jgi:hypothetical protein